MLVSLLVNDPEVSNNVHEWNYLRTLIFNTSELNSSLRVAYVCMMTPEIAQFSTNRWSNNHARFQTGVGCCCPHKVDVLFRTILCECHWPWIAIDHGRMSLPKSTWLNNLELVLITTQQPIIHQVLRFCLSFIMNRLCSFEILKKRKKKCHVDKICSHIAWTR